jgi:type VI secretion system protein VasG
MASMDLKQLVAKLNLTTRRTLEAAAGLCSSRTNYNVEIEHWLLKLLENSDSDLYAIVQHFGVNPVRLQADLTRAVDQLKTGSARSPALSPDVVKLIEEAWLTASVHQHASVVRSGHILLALVTVDALARVAYEASPMFEKISPESLRAGFDEITASSAEAADSNPARPAPAGSDDPARRNPASTTPSLDQYTIDLTARAKAGEIDPVLGRDSEIRQIMDILCRRRQNNPILTGEPGVGKTAVVEGFAIRLAMGDVPPSLRNVSLRTLDLGLLQAGAGVKGEFENRLKSVINEVKSSATPIVLFIDEAHTMIGAGGQAGQGDAANLLKPALARGELRTIAATTLAEYKQYFEKDAALARRFQVVRVEEPTESVAVEMMQGLVATLEKHHKVRILNEAINDAVKLSHRYISGRLLPDKSVSLLDTTCARIGLSQSSTPPAVEDAQRQVQRLAVSTGILQREQESGVDHSIVLSELAAQSKAAEQHLDEVKLRWAREKELVSRIHQLYAAITGTDVSVNAVANPPEGSAPKPAPLTGQERQTAIDQLRVVEAELKSVQGDHPMVFPYVDSSAVAETVESWTGIPVGRMVADEVNTVLRLKDLMEESVVGQSHAMEIIAKRIQMSRAGLVDPRRPIGVFLLTGTSGVGKTETAITLANLLYGGEQNMTTIDMSQLTDEEMAQTKLFGSTQGFVGYGEGGLLTEAVRRKPYSVVLLDEFEKAASGIQLQFYQIFDAGRGQDGEGNDIDFRNTIILMTTNAGSSFIKNLCLDPETRPDPEAFAEAIFPELLKSGFEPAFLGRITIVPYYPLAEDVMKRIVRLKLGKIARRVHENYKAEFHYTESFVDAITARCNEVDTGARNVDNILNRAVLPDLSTLFLGRMAEGLEVTSVNLSVKDDGTFAYEIH